jgi:hypothetical protein
MLFFFDYIGNNPKALTALFVIQVFVQYQMSLYLKQFEALSPDGNFRSKQPPDLWLGFEGEDLQGWIQDTVSIEACQAYINMARFDFFPYMITYPLLFGTLLYQQVIQFETLNDSASFTQMSYIFVAAMVADIVETIIPMTACQMKIANAAGGPQHSMDLAWYNLAAAANKLKWILLAVGMVLLTGLFISNQFFGGTSPADSHKQKRLEREIQQDTIAAAVQKEKGVSTNKVTPLKANKSINPPVSPSTPARNTRSKKIKPS